MSIDLKGPVRAAIVAETAITDELGVYKGAPAVFTKRPIPDDAPYPCIVIECLVLGDEDGLATMRPVVDIDVAVYGKNDPQGAEYRAVESIGYTLRNLFHRDRWSITPNGAHVVRITASGPRPAPVDDEKTVGRVVTLSVYLREEA